MFYGNVPTFVLLFVQKTPEICTNIFLFCTNSGRLLSRLLQKSADIFPFFCRVVLYCPAESYYCLLYFTGIRRTLPFSPEGIVLQFL